MVNVSRLQSTKFLKWEFNKTKAIIRLPDQLRQRFYKFTKESNLIDGSINLVTFEKWLEDQLKNSFNPLADIIIVKEHML